MVFNLFRRKKKEEPQSPEPPVKEVVEELEDQDLDEFPEFEEEEEDKAADEAEEEDEAVDEAVPVAEQDELDDEKYGEELEEEEDEEAIEPVQARGKDVGASLERTRGGLFGAVRGLFRQRRELNPEFWDELEERLIQADLGAHTTADLVDTLREQHAKHHFNGPEEAEAALIDQLVDLLVAAEEATLMLPMPVAVILIVGVNGVGKTTSIAKLGRFLEDAGRKPMFVAGDTFRAAAIDQLKIWGERTRIPVIAQSPGSDPGSVVFDGIQAARARGCDVLIIDTAGRLHTKTNLMEELKKVNRVIERQIPGAPHETLLVLDAVTGQNGLIQAQAFAKAVGVTGLILAKLDSSAKGGVVFSIAQELQLPIKFVGTGEKLDDFEPFNAEEFAEALFT